MTSWIHQWKKRGWKKADHKTPENVELFQQLDALANQFLSLKFHWVKGHNKDEFNERCDELCNIALDQAGH